MDDSGRQRWLRTGIPVGGLYFATGIVSAALAGAAASDQMRLFWRVSAFVISAGVFAVHVVHERYRLRNTARSTAWHASFAVAFGAFALALAPNLHDMRSAAGLRPRMLIALAVWPLMTAVPAFIAAFVAAAVLGVKRKEGAE